MPSKLFAPSYAAAPSCRRVEQLLPSGVHDDHVDALSLAFSKLEQTDLSVWLRL